MKILFLNLNIIDIRCDSRDSIKEQCRCIPIEVPSRAEWMDKKKQKLYEGYCKDFYCLLACSSKMRNLKQKF